jgi:hypothetical protein
MKLNIFCIGISLKIVRGCPFYLGKYSVCPSPFLIISLMFLFASDPYMTFLLEIASILKGSVVKEL